MRLVLAPGQISENGGESRVTARLSGATAEDVTVTVSAAAVAPAGSGDFALSVNRELTIAAGETASTGTVTVRAVDNAGDHPNREVTVAATVSGPAALEAPAAQTLTIADGDESNRPPAFSPTSYEFPLQEELAGRTAEVLLGTVSATDPEDEMLTYALGGGDAGRFAVGSSSGAVTYVGPGEDAETGPDRYALTVVARDPAGLEAEASVVVRIEPVNEAPRAANDATETPEDQSVVVDVLANDTDPMAMRCRSWRWPRPRTGPRRWWRAGSAMHRRRRGGDARGRVCRRRRAGERPGPGRRPAASRRRDRAVARLGDGRGRAGCATLRREITTDRTPSATRWPTPAG